MKEIDHETMVSTRGSGLGWKALLLLTTPIAFIMKTGLAFALANVTYDSPVALATDQDLPLTPDCL